MSNRTIGGLLSNDSSSDLVASTVKPFQPDSDRDLVRDVFVFFARFEYALKREGVLKGTDKKAEVDWDCYAKRVRHLFESPSPSINASVNTRAHVEAAAAATATVARVFQSAHTQQ